MYIYKIYADVTWSNFKDKIIERSKPNKAQRTLIAEWDGIIYCSFKS